MLLEKLENKQLIHPPTWLVSNTHYLTTMGSIAYGTATDTSDFDVYGFCIPQKTTIFRHLAGEIEGFGRQTQRFEQWIEHNIYDKDAQGGVGRTYDLQVFNIVKYFNLLLNNNPNTIDSIFTPTDCVLHCTSIGNMVRDNRKKFLHKGIIPQLRGYAHSQLAKAGSQTKIGKRKEDVEEFGFDRKHLYHLYRLTMQAEDILTTGELDLRKNREVLKTIRRGETSLDEARAWFEAKEKHLDKLYHDSKLSWGPDEEFMKQLLLQCLEHHFGSLDKCVVNVGKAEQTLRDIRNLLDERGF
jgi:predicted nucleotidyltransferase